MMLSDADKADLVRLASGEADPAARSRADALLKNRPEAVQYFARMRGQCELLSSAFAAAQSAVPEENLAAADLAALTARISTRADTMLRRRKWRSVIGLAAVLALVITPVAVWKLWLHRPIGQAVLFRSGFTGGTSTHTELVPIRRGMDLTTNKETAALDMDGYRLAISPETSVHFGKTIFISGGSVYVEGSKPTRLDASGLTVVAEGRVILSVIADRVTCIVLDGSADVRSDHGEERIPAGQQLILTSEQRAIGPAPTSLPIWVTTALKALETRPTGR